MSGEEAKIRDFDRLRCGHLPLREQSDQTSELLVSFWTSKHRSRTGSSQTAIVAGAASGIGRSIVQHFLDDGLDVVGLDVVPVDTPEHHDEKGAGDILGNSRSSGRVSLELFVDGLHEHAHPMERLSRAQAEHDRRGQRGNNEIVGRGMELQAAAD